MKGGTSSAHNDKPNDKPESPTTGNTNALPPKRPKMKKNLKFGITFQRWVIVILITLEHHVITVVKTMDVVGKGMELVIYGIIFIINAPCISKATSMPNH